MFVSYIQYIRVGQLPATLRSLSYPDAVFYLFFTFFISASRCFNSSVNDSTYFFLINIGCVIIQSADTAPSDALAMNNVSSTIFSYCCCLTSANVLVFPAIWIVSPCVEISHGRAKKSFIY